jgi:hypothetical protein
MKAKETKNNQLWEYSFQINPRKSLAVLVLFALSLITYAQNNNKVITIAGSRFASQLVEKWANEYERANEGVTVKFVKGDVPCDLTLTVSNDEKNEKKSIDVGLISVLPVISQKSSIFDKQTKNGVTKEEIKKIFTESESDEFADPQKSQEVYTIYTQNPQSTTTKVLLNYLGESVSEIPGVIVTGDDKYLIESVLSDSTGVTYGSLGLVYDQVNRLPLKGIRIIPIDPDNSGKLKKEEQVFGNLDNLISFLENTRPKTIPTAYLSFTINKQEPNPQAVDFANWVKISGQQYNHQYGFLKTNDEKDPALTQK